MKKTRMVPVTTEVPAAALLCDCDAPAAMANSEESQAGGQSVEGQPSEGQSAVQPAAQNVQGATGRTGGKKAAEGIAIMFQCSVGGVNEEALDYLASQLNEKNKLGIKVEAQYQGEYDDTINKLRSARVGNMGVDLMQIYDIGTRPMIDSGWTIPTQELIDGDGWDKPVIEPNIVAYYTVDEKLYSMLFNSPMPLLYYNKDMFEKVEISEVPESLGEIVDAVNALVQKGDAGEPISLEIYEWFFEQFTCKQGLSYMNNDSRRQGTTTVVEFDQNGAVTNMLTVWKDLHGKGYAPIVGRRGGFRLADPSLGKSAMTLGSTTSPKQTLEDVSGKPEVSIAYLPKVNPGDKGGVSVGGASLRALNSEDETRKAATWEFVEYLVSPESQAYWNTQTGYSPVTTTAYEEPVFKENLEKCPQFGTATNQLHDSTPESVDTSISVFPEARQVMEAKIESMLNNHISPQDTATNMVKQINKAIEEYSLLNE